METRKCSKCGKKVGYLEMFPNNVCINCYEKSFNENLKRTGILPKPDFMRAINI